MSTNTELFQNDSFFQNFRHNDFVHDDVSLSFDFLRYLASVDHSTRRLI